MKNVILSIALILSLCGFAFAIPDVFPPTPNPSQWAVTPQYITSDGIFYYLTMTAVTATDMNPPVYYLFDCVSSSNYDSGWITTPTWTNGPFFAESYLVYRCYTKDSLGNIGSPSPLYDTDGHFVIPEPATICLFAIAGLILRRKK
jgi:hypothetical protein